MQNQIYRGVQHDAKSQQNNQSNSSRTYRGVSFKQTNSARTAGQNARMNYRGSAYSKAV
jgi:hypothetical protein|tara:strand:+ start:768 stop:944 length:177 start_codon:yes stop_codon:yes gene_type:complete